MTGVGKIDARQHWNVESLPWEQLEPQQVNNDLLRVIKTAALVEANSADYVTYLHNVFEGDSDFCAAATVWGDEEAQHGQALATWAERIDPTFDFAASLKHFREGYSLPLDVTESVRGSPEGELLARCVVESGTCSFYSALRDASREPVLRRICHYIAQDESRHYQLFHEHFKRYLEDAPMSFSRRVKIALGRVGETEDDELAYAYYSANKGSDASDRSEPELKYDRKRCGRAYQQLAMGIYGRAHIKTLIHMIARAIGVNPGGRLVRVAGYCGWSWLRLRSAFSGTRPDSTVGIARAV